MLSTFKFYKNQTKILSHNIHQRDRSSFLKKKYFVKFTIKSCKIYQSSDIDQ